MIALIVLLLATAWYFKKPITEYLRDLKKSRRLRRRTAKIKRYNASEYHPVSFGAARITSGSAKRRRRLEKAANLKGGTTTPPLEISDHKHPEPRRCNYPVCGCFTFCEHTLNDWDNEQ